MINRLFISNIFIVVACSLRLFNSPSTLVRSRMQLQMTENYRDDLRNVAIIGLNNAKHIAYLFLKLF
jgi:hypothetical protein